MNLFHRIQFPNLDPSPSQGNRVSTWRHAIVTPNVTSCVLLISDLNEFVIRALPDTYIALRHTYIIYRHFNSNNASHDGQGINPATLESAPQQHWYDEALWGFTVSSFLPCSGCRVDILLVVTIDILTASYWWLTLLQIVEICYQGSPWIVDHSFQSCWRWIWPSLTQQWHASAMGVTNDRISLCHVSIAFSKANAVTARASQMEMLLGIDSLKSLE